MNDNKLFKSNKNMFQPKKLASLLFEREIVAYMFNSVLFHKPLIF